jgi:hypothetical protein
VLPTLNGRIQTRIALTLVVGGIWTLLIGPLLPVDASVGGRYAAAFTVLVALTVLGIGWELLYHLVQQFRWEKDWPTLFGLITVVPEALLLWALLAAGIVPGLPGGVPLGAFLLHVVTTWIVVWLVANGPCACRSCTGGSGVGG